MFEDFALTAEVLNKPGPFSVAAALEGLITWLLRRVSLSYTFDCEHIIYINISDTMYQKFRRSPRCAHGVLSLCRLSVVIL